MSVLIVTIRRCACAALLAVNFIALPAYAEDLAFKLINDTDESIVGFYVSHSGASSWEENLMDGAYLPAEHELLVQIADGRSVCEYDIRAEFSDGAVEEDYQLDLCELGEYTYED